MKEYIPYSDPFISGGGRPRLRLCECLVFYVSFFFCNRTLSLSPSFLLREMVWKLNRWLRSQPQFLASPAYRVCMPSDTAAAPPVTKDILTLARFNECLLLLRINARERSTEKSIESA